MPNVGSERISALLPNALIRTSGARQGNRLYLTFDDGPCPGVTNRLLDTLDAYGVKGSFFCIGEKLRQHRELAASIVLRGHGLHNHSDRHRNYRRLSLSAQRRDAETCQETIAEIHPAAKPVLRAPLGQLGLRALLSFRARGWQVVHWSFDSLDYRKPEATALVETLRQRSVRGGDVILFHDDSCLCVEVLEVMIPVWRSAGYDFATVDSLL